MASGSGRKRKCITLETKLKIIKKHDQNDRIVDIANHLGLAESTVRTIVKNKDAIVSASKNALPLHAKKASYARSPVMIRMEKLLSIFVEDSAQRRIPTSTRIIGEKARRLYQRSKLDYDAEDVEEFNASKGWFENFKKRSNFRSVPIQREAAGGNSAELAKFKAHLLNIMKEGGYTAQQLFDVDETGLFWKRMPRRTFISREERQAPAGYGVSKDRFTLLLGGNATGDCKLKPLLVCKSENLGAFEGIDKTKLPVHWTWNSKAWVTRNVFLNWYKKCLGLEVEAFCQKNDLAHKVILLLDIAPGHPPAEELHAVNPHVKIVYLPPNTTSSSRATDRGLISTFKSYYLRKTFSQAVTATSTESATCDLRQFWKNFDILDAVRNVGEAWKEVTERSLLAGVWKKVYNEADDGPECDENVTSEIVEMGKIVGLDLEKDDIVELLESDEQPLDDDDLIAMGEQVQLDDREQEECELQEGDMTSSAAEKNLGTQGLREALGLVHQFCDYIRECDPDSERSSKVINAIENDVDCYQVLVDERKRSAKQAKLYNHFRKT